MDIKTFLNNYKILKKEYKNWNAPIVTFIAVSTGSPFKILISTILSLRTKDQVTAKASIKLFKIVNSPEELLKLSVKKLSKLIYPVAFYNNKSKQILEICKILIEKYNSKVPDTLEQLLEFKGVGRKTANLVLSQGYGKKTICVDTHVHRISNRLGIVYTKTPYETELSLMNFLPKNKWIEINDLLVAFGQTICRPIGPKCNICKVQDCPSRKKEYEKI